MNIQTVSSLSGAPSLWIMILDRICLVLLAWNTCAPDYCMHMLLPQIYKSDLCCSAFESRSDFCSNDRAPLWSFFYEEEISWSNTSKATLSSYCQWPFLPSLSPQTVVCRRGFLHQVIHQVRAAVCFVCCCQSTKYASAVSQVSVNEIQYLATSQVLVLHAVYICSFTCMLLLRTSDSLARVVVPINSNCRLQSEFSD